MNKNDKPKNSITSIKIFIFSFALAAILWVWGLLSTRDLITNAMNMYRSLPTPIATNSISMNPIQSPSLDTTTLLRKVHLPDTTTIDPGSASLNSNSNPQPKLPPITNTGSSR
jgi:carbon starvation protein CstA